MGRAVGGASAAGCGVLGFGGLLIGIGLTVWLGSQVTNGVGGAGDDQGLKELTSEVSALVAPTGLGSPPDGRTITIAAPQDLADGGVITVKGVRFEPGPLAIQMCLTEDPDGADTSRCDASTTAVAVVDGRGEFSLPYPVVRVITVEGTAYDCASRPQACSVLGHRSDEPLDVGTTAALTFIEGLPPVGAAPPGS